MIEFCFGQYFLVRKVRPVLDGTKQWKDVRDALEEPGQISSKVMGPTPWQWATETPGYSTAMVVIAVLALVVFLVGKG